MMSEENDELKNYGNAEGDMDESHCMVLGCVMNINKEDEHVNKCDLLDAGRKQTEEEIEDNTISVEKWPLKIPNSKGRSAYKVIGREDKEMFLPVSHMDEIKSILFQVRIRKGTKKTGKYHWKPIGESRPAMRILINLLNKAHLAYHAGEGYGTIGAKSVKHLGDGTTFTAVWRALVNHGVITCDEEYIFCQKSYSYRTTDRWESKDVQWKLVVQEGWPVLSDDRPEIPDVELDKDAAKATLEKVFEMRKVVERWKKTKDEDGVVHIKPSTWQEKTRDVFLHRIDNFNTKYSVNEYTGGRLFTDANLFPKELRAHLIICGEKTVELDAKNCQPLLLASLYQQKSKESVDYIQLVQSGELYTVVRDDVAPGMTREEFKQRYFLPWLFGEGEKVNEFKPHIEKWFSARFPDLLEIIQGYMKFGPKALPRELQRRESKCIWRAVNDAKIPHISIHDGCRVRQCDLEAAEDVIKSAFKSYYGLEPKIIVADVMESLEKFFTERDAA